MSELSAQEQASLASRILAGDAAGEDTLVRYFHPRIVAMARARTRDADAAHDLAQETMIAAIEALRKGSVRETERLAAYIHGAARFIINRFIHNRVQRMRDEPLSEDLVISGQGDEREAADRVGMVHAELAQLEVVDRKILLLTLVEGAKPGEISTRLGLRPDVVRQRKCRALKKIVARVQNLSQKSALRAQ
jgi:RNA polymerase sigma factor (sigma-70 family)